MNIQSALIPFHAYASIRTVEIMERVVVSGNCPHRFFVAEVFRFVYVVRQARPVKCHAGFPKAANRFFRLLLKRWHACDGLILSIHSLFCTEAGGGGVGGIYYGIAIYGFRSGSSTNLNSNFIYPGKTFVGNLTKPQPPYDKVDNDRENLQTTHKKQVYKIAHYSKRHRHSWATQLQFITSNLKSYMCAKKYRSHLNTFMDGVEVFMRRVAGIFYISGLPDNSALVSRSDKFLFLFVGVICKLQNMYRSFAMLYIKVQSSSAIGCPGYGYSGCSLSLRHRRAYWAGRASSVHPKLARLSIFREDDCYLSNYECGSMNTVLRTWTGFSITHP